ncbi:MAG: glycerol-3-phosphate dehydrogenase [Chloroflexi bacterium]|nr:glycerol-3-phosphate dehydrogenase [Chloroflexota bacterium]
MAVTQARQNWLEGGVYDLIVIGGGINGAGVARDAAQRGMNVALLEKNDFSSGTTQAPTRLIHGGLRYLEHFEFSLVFESLQEREILLKIAPHLVKPLPFLIPIYKHSRRGVLLVNMGMLLYDMLSWNKSLPHYKPLSAKQVLEMEPGLDPDGLQGGVMYYDCQVDWPERLCLANALAARADGAYVRNYTEVIGFLGTAQSVEGVRVRERLTGREYELRSKLVVNAAGPWADAVTNLLTKEEPRRVLQTKGTHLVVPPFANAPKHAIYIEAKSDGRPYFVVPWVGTMLIGTTDDPYDENLDDVRPTEQEARYLLNEVNAIFPGAHLTTEDVQHTYTGLRGLPLQKGKSTGAVSRRSFVHDHEKEAGVRGLISIIGGKLTAYRSLAEEVVDHAQAKLKLPGVKPCRTRTTPLPGGDIADIAAYTSAESEAQARQYELQPSQIAHLIELYGTQHKDVLALVAATPALGVRLMKSRPDIAAEVAFAVEREMAVRLSDFFVRRSGLVTWDGRDEGLVRGVARIFAERLKWDTARTEAEIEAWRDERERLFTLQVPLG